MTEIPQTTAGDALPGVAAFLRGVERRGAVFAQLQCGDPVAGELAFAVALRQFTELAPGQPFGHWPRLFWRGLLAALQTQASGAAAQWSEAHAELGRLGAGPRVVLLLRLIAGLTDADAAAVLGVATPTYRLALGRALPRGEDGGPDPQAWQRLDQALQEAVNALPAEHVTHLALLRQTALQGGRPERIATFAQAPMPAEPSPRRKRLRWLLWAGLVLCVLVLLSSFLVPAMWSDDSGEPRIRTQPLGPATAPAQRYDADLALVTERDFELLLADAPTAPEDDPAFYAWLAAQQASEQGDLPDTGQRARAGRPEQTQADNPSEPPETTDAPL